MNKRFKLPAVLVTTGAILASPAFAGDKGGIGKRVAAPEIKGDGWDLKIGGRVHLDYADVDADTADVEFNDSELRRLRLKASGKIGKTVKYKAELNSSEDGEIDLTDVFVEWKPGDIAFKFGHHKTPNSLDEQTSSLFISTLERSAFTDAFELNRGLGLSLSTKGDNYTFAAGIFGDSLNDDNREKGHAVAARLTYNPVNTEEMLVHLGGSFRLREAGDGEADFRYRQRPVSHIPGRILSTGRIADSDTFIGIEAATIIDRFWFAGEYGRLDADCTAANCSDPTLDGAYLEAGFFIGGKKGYKGGKFNRPDIDRAVTGSGPDGGIGAVSFVARFDTIDLEDTGTEGDSGGSYDSFVLGADWWPTRYTRLSVNYFDVDADLGNQDSGLDSAFADVNGIGVSEDVSGFIFRAQVDF